MTALCSKGKRPDPVVEAGRKAGLAGKDEDAGAGSLPRHIDISNDCERLARGIPAPVLAMARS